MSRERRVIFVGFALGVLTALSLGRVPIASAADIGSAIPAPEEVVFGQGKETDVNSPIHPVFWRADILAQGPLPEQKQRKPFRDRRR